MTRLTRWSQRKRGLEPVKEKAPDDPSSLSEAGTEPDHNTADSTPLPPTPGEEAPPQAPADDLPDPDTLPPGSDLTAYLASGVSRELRRRALKRLFSADHYHQRDGLNDYDQDYRQLKNLPQEVADRLRQWTRQLDEEDDRHAVSHADTDAPATPSSGDPEDAPGSDDALKSEPVAERSSDRLGPDDLGGSDKV
ncbi:DUF3306 domain-containing protein [Halomonas sp. YLGW01]|uniref:DUF3306 domain-containing protein n=1 Tax=Halomonas sp. YLGW01 TaxID=2773308 RepID=UPI001786BA21|nr:DUF3306 domain-containing protein [Halomonas sp. YLGW01]